MPGRLTITAPRSESDLQIGRRIHKWLQGKRVNAELAFDGATVQVSMPFSGAKDLGLALDASTAWSILEMQEDPSLPGIYESGAVYAREPLCRKNGREHMCEEFVTAALVHQRGTGDCDDLGPYLVATLRTKGEDPDAHAFARPSAVGWHVVVRRGDGSIEDPSAKLGMPTK